MNDFILGIDIGQSQDPTASTLISRRWRNEQIVHSIVGVHQITLGTKYTEVTQWITAVAEHPTLKGKLNIVIDQTGVGKPIIDAVRDVESIADIVWGITITAGQNFSKDGMSYKVPKKDLVGALQVVLSEGRLLHHPKLPNINDLKRQLLDFVVERRAAGFTFEGRDSTHDDLVISTACAVWISDEIPLEENKAGDSENAPHVLIPGHVPPPRPAPSWREQYATPRITPA